MLKGFSSLPPGGHLTAPTTGAEWKSTISKVKRLHGARRFRLCSAKCCEILESIKDKSQVEPAYLIYLHFYAASSLEMAAQPILTMSPLRVKLLEQARNHYSNAAALIQAAEDSAVSKSRCSSSASTIFSRQHSPSGSVSSRAGTPLTDVSSPGCTSSMFNPPGPPPSMVAPTPPVKKKVSFYMPVPEEPLVRPDSPTLGFDDFEVIENASRDLPPLPPQPSRLSILKPNRPMVETPAYHGHTGRSCSVSSYASSSAGTMTTASTVTTSPDSYTITSSPSTHMSLCGSLEFDSNTYRTLSRFCSHLDGLRSQVAYHVAAVDVELATCTQSPTYDPSTSRPGSAMSNEGSRPGSRASISSDGMPLEHLNERLERLRANGWRRPRFDPSRYEALRERVLEELSTES
ncbi:hypothetical protein MKZ38_008629 [Zalerion maritima]|uniref:Uncharacterized protein n=1 Tax=Zalerion maritima TaxID=339359 RepID=A0AAD5RYF7_9PEZI|nr:hypothetical protein MKZ38_008629 [Zalerion maritima]